jgi:hypothetical protein
VNEREPQIDGMIRRFRFEVGSRATAKVNAVPVRAIRFGSATVSVSNHNLRNLRILFYLRVSAFICGSILGSEAF